MCVYRVNSGFSATLSCLNCSGPRLKRQVSFAGKGLSAQLGELREDHLLWLPPTDARGRAGLPEESVLNPHTADGGASL